MDFLNSDLVSSIVMLKALKTGLSMVSCCWVKGRGWIELVRIPPPCPAAVWEHVGKYLAGNPILIAACCKLVKEEGRVWFVSPSCGPGRISIGICYRVRV